MRDYYQVLGVDKTISQTNLKKRYYSLAKEFHPDKVAKEQKINAERRFKEISEAYNALSTPNKRKFYDSGGFQKNIVFSQGFSSTPNISKRELILQKLSKKVDFSVTSFAKELNVHQLNLEKILLKFFVLLEINGQIVNGKVKFG